MVSEKKQQEMKAEAEAMSGCQDTDCKKSLEDLKKDVYGDGPEGGTSVYGALKKKVSYKVLTLLLSAVLGVIGFFAGFGINHERRLTKTETTVDRYVEVIKKSCADIDMLKVDRHEDLQQILTAIHELKQ